MSKGLRISTGITRSPAYVEKSYHYKSFEAAQDDFYKIVELRNNKNSTQEISNALAPDEHYAYARWDVSEDGFGQYVVQAGILIPGRELWPKSLTAKTGKWDPSPASMSSFFAGELGAAFGLLDYINRLIMEYKADLEKKRQEHEFKELKGKLDKINPNKGGIRGDFPEHNDPHYSDGTMDA